MRIQRRLLLIFTGTLALVAVIVFVAADRSQVKYRFPMWREAVEQEGDLKGKPQVSIKLEGIDFGVDYLQNEEERDVIHVAVRVSSEQIAFGVNYWVDYLSDGNWYTVYDANVLVEPARILESGDHSLEYDVPAGLFRQKGQYRLCMDGLGYCRMDMVTDLAN